MPEPASVALPTPRYFTIANARFFCGVAALLNSLRLTGNDGEVVVLDTGLEADQRKRLTRHATVVDPPVDRAGNPTMYKAFPRLLEPRGTIVIIDSDMLVTGSLAPLVQAAEHGRICLFGDHMDRIRRFAEWQELFGLSAPPRDQPYLNAGLVVFSTTRWPALLERWWEMCWRIPDTRTRAYGAEYTDPLFLGDQDALNALLMSEVPSEVILELPQHQAPIFEQLARVRVVDERRLVCTHEGVPTVLLHEAGTPKVWERDAWMRVRGAYVQLAPRVLLAEDVTLRLDAGELAPWLRGGVRSRAIAKALGLVGTIAVYVVRRLPRGLRPSSEGTARIVARARARVRRGRS